MWTSPAGSGITVLFGASGSARPACCAVWRGWNARTLSGGRGGEVVWRDDACPGVLPTHQRALGYVFQEASLFGTWTYWATCGMASGAPSLEAEQPLQAAIELLGIGRLPQRRPVSLGRRAPAAGYACARPPPPVAAGRTHGRLDWRGAEILPLERLRDELHIPIMLYVTLRRRAGAAGRPPGGGAGGGRGQGCRAGGPGVVLHNQLPVVLGDDVGAGVARPGAGAGHYLAPARVGLCRWRHVVATAACLWASQVRLRWCWPAM